VLGPVLGRLEVAQAQIEAQDHAQTELLLALFINHIRLFAELEARLFSGIKTLFFFFVNIFISTEKPISLASEFFRAGLFCSRKVLLAA